jgi:anti-sigma regulatory factor (Ser/Thr protein kinase)
MGATRPRTAFSHNLLIYGSDDELLGTVVPFLRAGVLADQSAVVCCRPPTAGLLQDELGADAQVVYLDYDEIYSTPIAAITAYQQLIDSYLIGGTDHVRVVAEAVHDRTPDEQVDWARYEAVANRAMEAYPLSAVCVYDTRQVPTDMLEGGRLTHPTLITGTSRADNPHYVDPAEFLRRTNQPLPDPLEAQPPDLEMTQVVDLDQMRRQLEFCLFRTTHMAHEAADLVLAATEITTNAIRHGLPPVTIRLWVETGRCVCTVTDHGAGIDDPFAGYLWPGSLSNLATHGMGLWLARRLCDGLVFFHGHEGFTVRLIIQRGHTTPLSPHHRIDPA